MQFLLDDNKVYTIVGIVFFICLIIYYLPDKNNQTTTNLIPITTSGIVGYEPRYFNREIYSMPNAKGDPYVLYGSRYPDTSNDPSRAGFQRLLPTMENLPKIGNVQGYMVQT